MTRSKIAAIGAVVLGLSSAVTAAADPDENWAEQGYLLHASYKAPPHEVWRVGFDGPQAGAAPQFSSDESAVFLTLRGADEDEWVGVDADNGEVFLRIPIPSGSACQLDQNEHLVVCQSDAQVSVFEERSGERLSRYDASGEVVSAGIEHGMLYILSHAAPGEGRGNAELAVGPPAEPGSQVKAVFRLPGELPSRRPVPPAAAMGLLQSFPQLLSPMFMQPLSAPGSLMLDVVTHQGKESVYSEITLDLATGRVTVRQPSVSFSEHREEWGPDRTVVVSTKGPHIGYRVVDGSGRTLASGPETAAHEAVIRIGDEANTVVLAGCTVYDRGTVAPLWSNPALCDKKRGSTDPVEAIVGSSLITSVIEQSGITDRGFDVRTGRLLWEQHRASGQGWPVPLGFLTDGERAIGTEDPGRAGDLVAVDLATGEEVWRTAPPGGAVDVRKLGGSDLFVLGPTGIARYAPAG